MNEKPIMTMLTVLGISGCTVTMPDKTGREIKYPERPSAQSQFQPYPPDVQIDIQKEIARLRSVDPVEKEDAAFKLACESAKARSAIPHLIDLVNDETPVTVRSQVPFSALADHYMVVNGDVREAADSALRRITGKTGGVSNWHEWWRENPKELTLPKRKR